MTRANARELAVHLIYGREFTGEEPEQVVNARLDKEYYQKLASENNIYEERPSGAQVRYLDMVVAGVANRSQELNEQIGIMRSQYVNTNKLETELHQRMTIPMASLIFTLVGVPLGMQPNRNSSSIGFVMSIIIIFIYYSLMTMAGAIAQGGIVNPMLAVWLPNIIGLLAGGYLMRRMAR